MQDYWLTDNQPYSKGTFNIKVIRKKSVLILTRLTQEKGFRKKGKRKKLNSIEYLWFDWILNLWSKRKTQKFGRM